MRNPLGLSSLPARRETQNGVEQVVLVGPLKRVLAFTGYSIDDVVENPIAKNVVREYFKLHKFVERGCEIVDLERWWSP